MADFSEVLGAILQSDPSQSTLSRLQEALGDGGPLPRGPLEGLLKGSGLNEVLPGLRRQRNRAGDHRKGGIFQDQVRRHSFRHRRQILRQGVVIPAYL